MNSQSPQSSGGPSPNTSRADFIRRLSYFLIGTAIGLFILGIITEQRKRAKQNMQPPAAVPAPGP